GKNELLVIPNPMRIFEKWVETPGDSTFKSKTMYVYFEMYGLSTGTSEMPATYNVSYRLKSHASGNRTSLPGQKNVRAPGSEALKVFAVDFMTFPPDVYTLETTVRDNLTGAEVTRQAIFEVVQPPPPPPPVTVLTQKQADRGYRMLKFMATPRDLSLYEKLDLEGKTEFLVNFWKERDPTPDTPENELMIVFNERFSFAEYQLGGADSDRGKIFMKYGEPEEIERFDSGMGTKPYQIWYYVSGVDGDPTKREGGNRDFFVFGDRLNVGRYELLHGTEKNGIYNPDWRKLLDLATPQTQFRPTTELKPGEQLEP
ncbi:MAG: GWxTD domain-containing protein, partial [candidate division Zixibacteria bacterium]|nr:GWxTD domain-containing protein [candidate division Zixibacteria bacterium]